MGIFKKTRGDTERMLQLKDGQEERSNAGGGSKRILVKRFSKFHKVGSKDSADTLLTRSRSGSDEQVAVYEPPSGFDQIFGAGATTEAGKPGSFSSLTRSTILKKPSLSSHGFQTLDSDDVSVDSVPLVVKRTMSTDTDTHESVEYEPPPTFFSPTKENLMQRERCHSVNTPGDGSVQEDTFRQFIFDKSGISGVAEKKSEAGDRESNIFRIAAAATLNFESTRIRANNANSNKDSTKSAGNGYKKPIPVLNASARDVQGQSWNQPRFEEAFTVNDAVLPSQMEIESTRDPVNTESNCFSPLRVQPVRKSTFDKEFVSFQEESVFAKPFRSPAITNENETFVPMHKEPVFAEPFNENEMQNESLMEFDAMEPTLGESSFLADRHMATDTLEDSWGEVSDRHIASFGETFEEMVLPSSAVDQDLNSLTRRSTVLYNVSPTSVPRQSFRNYVDSDSVASRSSRLSSRVSSHKRHTPSRSRLMSGDEKETENVFKVAETPEQNALDAIESQRPFGARHANMTVASHKFSPLTAESISRFNGGIQSSFQAKMGSSMNASDFSTFSIANASIGAHMSSNKESKAFENNQVPFIKTSDGVNENQVDPFRIGVDYKDTLAWDNGHVQVFETQTSVNDDLIESIRRASNKNHSQNSVSVYSKPDPSPRALPSSESVLNTRSQPTNTRHSTKLCSRAPSVVPVNAILGSMLFRQMDVTSSMGCHSEQPLQPPQVFSRTNRVAVLPLKSVDDLARVPSTVHASDGDERSDVSSVTEAVSAVNMNNFQVWKNQATNVLNRYNHLKKTGTGSNAGYGRKTADHSTKSETNGRVTWMDRVEEEHRRMFDSDNNNGSSIRRIFLGGGGGAAAP